MNLMSLVAKLSLDSQEYSDGLAKSEKEASSFGSSLGKGLGTAAKVAGVAIGAAATAVGGLTKSAVENYAEYEQLVGGVETLFGAQGMTIDEYADSVGKSTTEVQGDYDRLMRAQNKMFSQAANAYKTAGMSANDYMETATSFAASLVSSLGGNTEEAANVANTAITDMSDNANKMGTDISMIQNAYQGFAKQNYTMLDNLKLGYGGTKAEMTRLIEDANKLKKAHGEMADLSIDSYADIVEAIHLVQDEMGITGTTAKEASTTIQGSLSSARGAWQNLLTGIADDNQDFGVLVDNFIETLVGTVDEGGERVGGVINNILPRVETALSGIGELIKVAVPELLEIIPPLITDLLPNLVEAATSLVQSFVEVLPDIITAITDVLPSLLDIIGQGLIDSMATLTDKIPDIADALSQTLSDVLTWVTENAGDLIDGFADFLSTLLTEGIGILSDNKEEIVQALFAVIKAIVQAAIEHPELVAAIVGMKALSTIGSTIISGISTGLNTAKASLTKAIASAVTGSASSASIGNAGENLGQQMAQNTGSGFSSGLSTVFKTIATSAVIVEGFKMLSLAVKSVVDENLQLAPGFQETKVQIDQTMESTNLLTDAYNLLDEKLGGVKTKYELLTGEQSNVDTSTDALIGVLESFEHQGNAVTDVLDGWIGGLDMSGGAWTKLAEYLGYTGTEAEGMGYHLQMLYGELFEAYEAEKQAQQSTEDLGTALTDAGTVTDTASQQISESLGAMVEQWAQTFGTDMPAELQTAIQSAENAGYEIPQGLVTGIDTGNIEVTSAIDRMNALIDFTTAVQNAGLGGTEVSQSFVNSWLAGEYDWTTANNYLNGLVDFTTAINEAMSSGTEVTTEFVNGLLNQYGLDGVINAAEVIGKSAKPTIVPNEIHEVGTAVNTEMSSAMESSTYMTEDAAQGIHDAVTQSIDPLTGEMSEYGDTSTGNFDSAVNGWSGTVQQTVYQLYEFFSNQLGDGLASNMTTWGYTASQNFDSGINLNADSISTSATNIADSVTSAFDPLPGLLESAGYDGGAGLYSGFQSWEGALYSLASNIAWNISSTIRRAFNSHSPSRVMMAIGDDVGEGLKIGIEESGERAISAAEGIAESIIDASTVTGSYDAAVSPQNRQEQLYSMLAQYLPEMVNRPVILDSGELVGAIGPKMNERFQTYDVIGKRGGTAYA